MFERTGNPPTRPESSTSLANLSDEELAALAEIDNLTLLLNQFQPMTANTLTSELGLGEQPESGNLLEMLGQAQPSANRVDSQPTQTLPQSPFAAYLERTRFKVSDLANPEPTIPGRNTASLTPSSLLSGPQTSPAPVNQPALSPLQQALSQSTGGLTGLATTTQDSSRENSPSPDSRASATTNSMTTTSTPGLAPPSWLVEGRLPGVNQRFIRTTSEMSPPPGTTGYTLPWALQPPNPGTLPAAALPPPAPLNLNLGATSVTPAAAPGPGVTAPGATLPPPLGSPS
ncbi:MAG: hypothetical protein HC929_11485 [Leptolyngbyaceae cyanobacterium SM2_5_2]|nr:hypothetical protein [Leptolyngbyaceae cyanobacterium SM2_5_2]